MYVGLQKIRVRAFARLRVGPTRFSIRDRYLIPTFAVHTGHVRMQRVTTIAPLTAYTLPEHSQSCPVSMVEDRHMSALPKDACDEDLTEQAPRSWNCLPAAATESYIRDTTDLLDASLRET